MAVHPSERRSGIRRVLAAGSVPVGLAVAALLFSACGAGASGTASTSGNVRAARPTAVGDDRGHVVIVVFENHSYSDVIGRPAASYLNNLARSGELLTDMHAIRHPSQPNYIGLFAGGTQGVVDDSCPQQLRGPSLASELQDSGKSFVGYSENLPARGSGVCFAPGKYARKHAPWTDFADLPASTNQPLTAFPQDFSTLPTVSFVIPSLDNDMHDGSVARADDWTRRHLDAYATWARSHDSLLVVTWDEDDLSSDNHIPTFVVGAGVEARQVGSRMTTYSILRAVEDRYGLPRLGNSATAPPLGLP